MQTKSLASSIVLYPKLLPEQYWQLLSNQATVTLSAAAACRNRPAGCLLPGETGWHTACSTTGWEGLRNCQPNFMLFRFSRMHTAPFKLKSNIWQSTKLTLQDNYWSWQTLKEPLPNLISKLIYWSKTFNDNNCTCQDAEDMQGAKVTCLAQFTIKA